MPRNFCQNPLCHLFDTNDRLKKGEYKTRKAKKEWFNFFCTQDCFHQYFNIYASRIINYIGLKTEPSFRNQIDLNYWYRKDQIQNRPDYNWQTTNCDAIINQELNQN